MQMLGQSFDNVARLVNLAALDRCVPTKRAADCLDQRLRAVDDKQAAVLGIQATLDQVVQQRRTTAAFSVAPSSKPSGCLAPLPSMPIAVSRVSSLLMCMPSIWIASRSRCDRSADIQAFIRSADSATNRRDTADFDTPLPAVAAMSPSGRRTARPKRRVD